MLVSDPADVPALGGAAVGYAEAGTRMRGLLGPVDRVGEAILVVALLGELGVIVLDVVARSFGSSGFLWTQEVAQFALSVITFIGGAVAYRGGQHSPVRIIVDRLSPAGRATSLAFADWLVLIAAIVVGQASIPAIEASWGERTPILSLPAAVMVIPLAVCMVLLALYALARILANGKRMALRVGVPLILVLAATVTTRAAWLPFVQGDAGMYGSLVILFAVVLAGLPIGFALMLAGSAYLWGTNAVPLLALPQNMVNGTSNFVLLAVPFFIFAGLIMERGGISLRLVRLVHALVGHWRGGLLQVMVGSMYLVSGLSGAKVADVAAVGTVMRDMLQKERISDAEGAAVLAASAVMGETVPPSIAILVLGSITNLSIAALFLGGLAPAAVIAVCLMLLIWVRARKSATRPWVGGRVLLRAGLGAVLPLVMPVGLVAGIVMGVATPTEVSAFAVLYGLALATLGYRAMSRAVLIRTIVDTAMMAGMVLFILAAAGGFSWSLTIAHLPQRLVELLNAVGNSQVIFLIGSLVLLIVIGTLLEGLPALNVLAPLLLPIAGAIGLSQLHYGIMLVIAMGIGAFMPLAGVGFYVCCAVMRSSVEDVARAMLPYLVVLIVGLLIVTFIPWFTLFLPRAFGFA
jgi:tripartite ATP-independent transporter DctM subunit